VGGGVLTGLERDENLAFAFAVSTLAPQRGILPQCRVLYIPPLSCLNPKSNKTSVGHQFWCAEQEAGVSAMRVYQSDLPLDV
jgi:hypothetical protein